MERWSSNAPGADSTQSECDGIRKALPLSYEDCQGRHFEHHQEVDKPLKNTTYRVVAVHRYHCLRCRRTPAVGGDLTSVKCNGEWLPLGLTVDDMTGLILTVDALDTEVAKPLLR